MFKNNMNTHVVHCVPVLTRFVAPNLNQLECVGGVYLITTTFACCCILLPCLISRLWVVFADKLGFV